MTDLYCSSPVNQRFEIDHDTATKVWKNAGSLPAETGRGSERFAHTMRRSQDGEWLIRRFHGSLATEPLRQHMDEELGRLQQLGLTVISYATVAVPASPRDIFIVSPWISGLVECRIDTFHSSVSPVLSAYYKKCLELIRENPAHCYYGPELTKPDQYCVAKDAAPAPILTDITPNLVQGSHWAHFGISRTSIGHTNYEQ